MQAKLKCFRWKALNRQQKIQRGMLVAESRAAAEQLLFARQFRHIRLQRHWSLSTRVKAGDIAQLIAQLAVLLQAAVPLKQSLQLVQQQCLNVALNAWLRKLLSHIESGLSFSQALQQESDYFSHQERQLIIAGEMSGKLAEVCRRLAEHRKQQVALQQKIRKILFYPLLVLGISLGLTVLLLLFIVPQFAEMYADRQAALPLFTRILLQLSAALQQYGWLFGGMIGIAFWGIRRLLSRLKGLNRLKVRLISHIFLLKEIVRLSRVIRFADGLQLMLQSGVPLTAALQSFLPQKSGWQVAAAFVQEDDILLEEVADTLNNLKQGYGFADSVSENLMPQQAQTMLRVGEQSGQLPFMLQQIAEDYRNQLNYRIDLLSQLLEPLLMVLIGGLIGLIMLGMYLPIFNMGSVFQ